jgi:FtsZ-binding cell division protein ZapB
MTRTELIEMVKSLQTKTLSLKKKNVKLTKELKELETKHSALEIRYDDLLDELNASQTYDEYCSSCHE